VNPPAAWDPDEARGRALFAQLRAEARREIESYEWRPRADVPPLPHIVRTDTGTMRAVVVSL
jgi:hypothetical protein